MNKFVELAFVGIIFAFLTCENTSAAENVVVKAVPSIAIKSEKPIPINISVGASAATGVKVGHVTLIEKQFKRPIAPEGLRLCKTADKTCTDTSLTLEANSSHELWLWGVKEEGIYEGTITITTAEKPTGEPPATMLVYVSSDSAKIFGIILIAVSVIVAFLFGVVFRSLLNRKQFLLPASSIRETLLTLNTNMALLPDKIKKLSSDTSQKIEQLLKSLDVNELEKAGLPPLLPKFSPSLATSESYKTYIGIRSQTTQVLSVVVLEGLAKVGEFVDLHTNTELQQAVTTIQSAAQYKDTVPPTEDAVRQAIKTALDALQKAAAIKGFNVSVISGGKTVESPNQLRVEIAVINSASWIFVLFITTIVGAVALILTGDTSLGFGTLSDYVKCVLWGLGLPAGTQLASATTSTVSTTYGVPK